MGWTPTPVQEIALSSTADEILFGGSRGGGKTDTALHWLLYDVENPAYRGLVIRRNATDLADFIDRARTTYNQLGATVSGNPATIKFPSGAIIYTGHLATPDAYTKYQGWEIHRLLMEEVTHIPSEKLYEKLLGSVRSTVPGITTQVFLTTNPGGVGHEWVKARFAIDSKPSRIKFSSDGRTFIYINATIRDNPHLMKADPQYLKYLESLPGTLREQWLNGSWADMEIDGAYYIKQINIAEKDNRITTIPIESSLKTYTFWDLGISDATSIWTVQANGREIRIVDYYENSGEGLKHYVNYLHDLRDRYNFTYEGHYLPHDIRVRELSTGQSREVALRKMGINCRLVPNKGIADGIEAARNIIGRCWFDAENCKDGIKSLKNYRKEFDEKRNTYKDTALHDWASHGADAFRYFALAWTEHLSKDVIPRSNGTSNEWSPYDV
jgi:hypothetical protein